MNVTSSSSSTIRSKQKQRYSPTFSSLCSAGYLNFFLLFHQVVRTLQRLLLLRTGLPVRHLQHVRMWHAMSMKEAVKQWESQNRQKISQAVEIKLTGICPALDKMDTIMLSFVSCEWVYLSSLVDLYLKYQLNLML